MITLKSNKASVPVQVRCVEQLTEAGQWIADTVASFDGQGRGLADGVTAQIGWTIFRLRGQPDGSLLVCEPDYSGDPFNQVREDISVSLAVMLSQVNLLKRFNVAPKACRFDEKVIVRKGMLSEPRIFANRLAPSPGDSGWYIGPAEARSETPKPEDLEALHMYELIDKRPHVLFAFGLPVGTLVVWHGEEIVAIADAQGRSLTSTAA